MPFLQLPSNRGRSEYKRRWPKYPLPNRQNKLPQPDSPASVRFRLPQKERGLNQRNEMRIGDWASLSRSESRPFRPGRKDLVSQISGLGFALMADQAIHVLPSITRASSLDPTLQRFRMISFSEK